MKNLEALKNLYVSLGGEEADFTASSNAQALKQIHSLMGGRKTLTAQEMRL